MAHTGQKNVLSIDFSVANAKFMQGFETLENLIDDVRCLYLVKLFSTLQLCHYVASLWVICNKVKPLVIFIKVFDL